MGKVNRQFSNLCRNCKYFTYQRINKDTFLYGCKKDSESFSLDESKPSSERNCYKKKLIKRRDKDG